jgi:hypothetical protein
MQFNLNLEESPERGRSGHEESKDIEGSSMVLLIELPDGRVLEEEVRANQFKAGVNVEWVAYQVSLKTEIDFKAIVMIT